MFGSVGKTTQSIHGIQHISWLTAFSLWNPTTKWLRKKLAGCMNASACFFLLGCTTYTAHSTHMGFFVSLVRRTVLGFTRHLTRIFMLGFIQPFDSHNFSGFHIDLGSHPQYGFAIVCLVRILDMGCYEHLAHNCTVGCIFKLVRTFPLESRYVKWLRI